MITVATFDRLEEADLLKCRLEGHDISAFIPDASTVQMNFFYAKPIGGVRVQVEEEDVEAANELLQEADADAGSFTELTCPSCGSRQFVLNGCPNRSLFHHACSCSWDSSRMWLSYRLQEICVVARTATTGGKVNRESDTGFLSSIFTK
jgi:hypothetical protein